MNHEAAGPPEFQRGRPADFEMVDFFAPGNEVIWAKGRRPDRTYLSTTFRLDIRASRDRGQPARYVTKVFDEVASEFVEDGSDEVVWTEDIVMTTPGGRKQLKLMVAREAGQVRELIIQQVPTSPTATKLDPVLKLDREAAGRLVELIQALPYIPVDGGEKGVRLDDQTMRDFFADPDAVLSFYKRDPERFRQLIASDAQASDVVALAHRKEVVAEFRRLLEDDAYFDHRAEIEKSKERVWQKLLEANPWILGISLTGQLLTSWDDDRLEQTVAGFSVAGGAKRTDALLRTSGQIRSLVFAEIKHHRTEIVSSSDYRSDVWPPSPELSGGVSQAQQTVYKATLQLKDKLPDLDDAGAETGEDSYLVRPRSFLILGTLDQLRGDRGVHPAKFRSFELFRRCLTEPEVITFDELLARAEWHVEVASVLEQESADE